MLKSRTARSTNIRAGVAAPWRRAWSAAPMLWLAGTLAVTGGCHRVDLSGQLAGDAFDRETQVFDRLRGIPMASVSEAYGHLDSLTYRLETETRQTSDEGRTVATESRRIRMEPGRMAVEQQTSHGEMARGFMAFAVASDSIPDQSRRLVDLWIPEEPAFSSPRNREYYRYAQARDTIVSREACYLFDVRALPGVSPDKMPMRSVRLAVAQSDSALLWIRVRRQDDALFYRERSELQLVMGRLGSGQLVPALREVDVTVEAPLRRAHHFTSTQTYRLDPAPDLSP